MKELNDMQPVCDCLGTWLGQIRARSALDFYDINRVSENTAAALLNLVFKREFKNLNIERKHFPGIDLGDDTNKEAFQVTSRSDPAKIETDLKTFAHNHKNRFPGGIRFLILNNEKPRLSKQKYEAICPEFDPERDILNDRDLIEEIAKIYRQDKKRFQRIREFLENQFPQAQPKTGVSIKTLRLGSKTFYHKLRGPNGRFRYLDISRIILPGIGTGESWLETRAAIESAKETGKASRADVPAETTQETVTPDRILPLLWQRQVTHAVVLGDGGMGKTVSLIHWWEQLLDEGEQQQGQPVPLFIALNEFNQVPEEHRKDFIISYIREHYCLAPWDKPTAAQVKELMKTLPPIGSEMSPGVVLLLDAFNEVTLEKRELLLELNHLTEQCPGIQVVITSRYDMRGNLNWNHWNLVRLKELEQEKVSEYLRAKGTAEPEQERLRGLIKNPMMLTLYAAACEVQKNQQDSRYCCFKEIVESPGELLWNFIEAQAVKYIRQNEGNEPQKLFYKFLLKMLLPALGYEMEKAGQFQLTGEELDDILAHYFKQFCRADFLRIYREYRGHTAAWNIEGCGLDEVFEKVEYVLNILSTEMSMLVKEGRHYRFLHHNFRDFFAAVFLLNEAEISLSKGDIPGVFKERVLDFSVRQLLGEIQGEHRSKPYLMEEQGWKIDIHKDNLLHRLLDLCRGKFGEEVGYAVCNIVLIWKEVRGELSGADLSGLDLSRIPLNGVRCSRFYQADYLRYLAAVFDGSRVHEKNLLPQGHTDYVTSAMYSPDGKKILSASWDKTVKEWDAGTGQCVKTLAVRTDCVKRALYSPDGKKILTASQDGTIKVWDTETGECVKTLTRNCCWLNSAVYSQDGKKILTASDDQTIKEFVAETGECVRILVGHSHDVESAVYSRDGKKILSASDDKTIKEWDAETGECVKTLAEHSHCVKSAIYSRDGKKILSASVDNTIKEWDVETGECVKTLAGHSHCVKSAVYSRDGKKILSASFDETIKEWDAETGDCMNTLAGHTGWVTSAEYSFNGKKILSSSDDNTIKEWDTATGKCLKTHQKKDKPSILGYPSVEKSIYLEIFDNKIYELDVAGKKKDIELVNIPGLFIQGCSFQNLEKGSEWSEKGLKILRQYNARVSGIEIKDVGKP